MRWLVLLGFLAGTVLLSSCQPEFPPGVETALNQLPERIDYNQHVKPILSDKCFACHGPDQKKQKAGLRLDIAAHAYGELPENPGNVAISPGSLRGSELIQRILSTDSAYRMPTLESHLTLSDHEKAVLVKWIRQGAEYKPHWAFVRPTLPPLPKVRSKEWALTPIDYFVLHGLEENKLSPAPPAAREDLLRRVSFDLTGLPPTLAEIDSFLRDPSPKAYEKVVDRLLSSPHFGERMATDWLDVARFADSHGYTVDRLRDMSPYRDWVIKAFNDNQPYDRFLQWQLAGDLMPGPGGQKPTKDMLIATAFNRNHQQNMEGGIIEEEFQTEYVMDRTDTFGVAFLGLTVGCARCHDHKYDPVSQKNYYQLFSFFNNVREAGQISWDNALPTPTLLLPKPEQEKLIAFMNDEIQKEEVSLIEVEQASTGGFTKWLKGKEYRQLARKTYPERGLVARFSFENDALLNEVNPTQKAFVTREFDQKEEAMYVPGRSGQGLVLNGDAWLELDNVGIFRKSDPFTIGLWVTIPSDLKEGVIFHKALAERLYNYRGYQLYLRKDGTLEVTMAHTAPSNAITKVTKGLAPRDQWIHLSLTYDGTSKAQGLSLYLNGRETDMDTEIDQLTKDILFAKKTVARQPCLQIGAWYRGNGFKKGRIDDIMVYDRALTPYEVGVLAGTLAWAPLVVASPEKLSQTKRQILQRYYLAAVHPPSQQQRKKLRQLRATLADSLEAVKEIMVMQEMPRPRPTFLLNRGSYDAPAERVYPGTPEQILPFPSHFPKNRYGLAQWLTLPNHPLTSRVVVNRLWQNLFGTGLVRSSEDFGNQGELPSHPALLDYLAVTFVKSGWDVKKLMKIMVMSASYRQGSRASRLKLSQDPDNRFLSRGPANRLTAEMLRDNALKASGLLNEEIGGESIKPYQPAGLWEINNTKYSPDSGKKVYKRSLYVLIKRSVPHPTLATYDAPSRSYCVIRRQKTATPLQALVTLNDPTFLEACKVLGAQMARKKDSRAALIQTYRKLTGKPPTPTELNLLVEFYTQQYKKFRQAPRSARGWLRAGQYVVDKSLPIASVAAYAVTANVILNSDATLTKR